MARLTQSSNITKPKRGISTSYIVVVLIIVFISVLAIVTFYVQNQIRNNSLTQTTLPIDSKTLIIGTDATNPPMEYLDSQGNIKGYDVDLANKIASETKLKIIVKNVPWINIFDDLLNKKIDMIISSVTITEDRKQKYAFSDPYLNAGQVIVALKTSSITNTSDLKGMKISVQKGTTNEKEADNYTAANLVESFDNYNDAAKAVSNGKVDAMIADYTLAKGLITQFPSLKVASDPFTNEYYGIVLRKEDSGLLKKINDALGTFTVNGTFTNLRQIWLD